MDSYSAHEQGLAPPRRLKWLDCLTFGFSFYYLSSLLVLAGVWFGTEFLVRQPHPERTSRGFWNSLGNWDGVWYARIARDGYSYDVGKHSSIAFFPAYPLLGAMVARTTELSEERALLVVSQFSSVAAFGLAAAYLRRRYTDGPPSLISWTLLVMGIWPVSYFLRMAYTESLFLMIIVLALYGLLQRWPTFVVALIVGFATAVRPVGVALIAPLALGMWRRRKNWSSFFLREMPLLPVACWGICAFMAYQHFEFGDAFAFAKTQRHWSLRADLSWGRYTAALLTLEPIWSKFQPSSVAYWSRNEPVANPLFSLEFMNPICFVFTAGVVAYGGWRKWLNGEELLLAAGLLLIPYVTQSYRMGMAGHARFAAVVFPFYLVLGQLLARAPAPLSAAVLAIFAFFLGTYSALFAAWYRFF
jgi:hypothetical protein